MMVETRGATEVAPSAGTHQVLAPQEVRWGVGSVSALADGLEASGIERALLLTTRSLAGGPAERVIAAARGRLAVGWEEIAAQVPIDDVDRVADRALETGADGIVAFGGGSVIDGAKAVVVKMAAEGAPILPQVALPTTLSGAEYAHFYGVTADGLKRSFLDERAVAVLVLLDPQLTERTPSMLWAGSGIKAIDHAVESVLAGTDRPVCDPLARVGITAIASNLGPSSPPDAAGTRLICQVAAWQCYYAPANATLGLSHRIGHVLGGTYGIPHSLTSGVTLPLVLEAQATVKPMTVAAIAEALAGGRPLSRATGSDTATASAADLLRDLVGGLGLPGRLGELGLELEDIPNIAATVAEHYPDQLAVLGSDGQAGLERMLESGF